MKRENIVKLQLQGKKTNLKKSKLNQSSYRLRMKAKLKNCKEINGVIVYI